MFSWIYLKGKGRIWFSRNLLKGQRKNFMFSWVYLNGKEELLNVKIVNHLFGEIYLRYKNYDCTLK